MTFFDRAVVYWQQSKELLRDFPSSTSVAELLRFYPDWYRNLDRKESPLATELPWLPFTAIRRLTQIIRPSMRVFEFGSGGSTLFFARQTSSVTSVEHDRHWGELVVTALKTHGYINCELRMVLPDATQADSPGNPSDPDAYATSDESLRCYSFLNYASSIDSYPDQYFDLICIDGRARPSCFKHALPKVAIGGYIVWDDSHRQTYQPTLQLAVPCCKRKDYGGPVAGHIGFVQTSILERVRALTQ